MQELKDLGQCVRGSSDSGSHHCTACTGTPAAEKRFLFILLFSSSRGFQSGLDCFCAWLPSTRKPCNLRCVREAATSKHAGSQDTPKPCM